MALTFVDEWNVRGSASAVFAVLSDLRTYSRWGGVTYRSCESDGPPAPGRVVRVCIKGPLPFQLRFDATITHLENPSEVRMAATGDFDGDWHLSLVPDGESVKVRSQWRLTPRRPPPRFLEPLLRPLFRWNHTSMINRANAGLQRYLDDMVAASSVAAPMS
jgi:hypothetical protein